MIRTTLKAVLLLLFLVTSGQAQDRIGYFFSTVFKQSNLIVKGNVTDITIEPNAYKMTFNIEELFFGPGSSSPIEIFTRLSNWYFLEDEAYLSKGKSYILFLNNDKGYWSVTDGMGGVFSLNFKDDIQNIVQKFQANPNLFEPESISDLQELFFSSTMHDTKMRLLNDMRSNLSNEDLPFLQSLFEMDNRYYKAFSISKLGHLKIEQMRPQIENLLKSSSDNFIISPCISALGDIGNKESFNLIKDYLRNENQGIRCAAIEASGKIRDISALQLLRELYPFETSIYNRPSIITAVTRMPDKSAAVNTLKYFLTIENNPVFINILKKRIESIEKKK